MREVDDEVVFESFVKKGFFPDFLHPDDVVVASADYAGNVLAPYFVGIEAQGCNGKSSCRLHNDGILVIHVDDGGAYGSFRNGDDVVEDALADFIGQGSCLLDCRAIYKLVNVLKLNDFTLFDRCLHARCSCRLDSDDLGRR